MVGGIEKKNYNSIENWFWTFAVFCDCDLLNWGGWLVKSQERNWRTHYNFICEPKREETVGALIGIGGTQKISLRIHQVEVKEEFRGFKAQLKPFTACSRCFFDEARANTCYLR